MGSSYKVYLTGTQYFCGDTAVRHKEHCLGKQHPSPNYKVSGVQDNTRGFLLLTHAHDTTIASQKGLSEQEELNLPHDYIYLKNLCLKKKKKSQDLTDKNCTEVPWNEVADAREMTLWFRVLTAHKP